MKINLNDIFDQLDVRKSQQIVNNNISFKCDSDITERIKKKTFLKLNLINDKNELFMKNKKHIGIKALAAIFIAFAIVCGSISAAVVFFMPDNVLPEFFTVNDYVFNIVNEMDAVKDGG